MTPEQVARFWANVDTSGDCWLWLGTVNEEDGYGRFYRGRGRSRLVHRISVELLDGPIPEGREIDHRCLNKLCVKPTHLRIATRKQNQENLTTRKRSRSGARGVDWHADRGKWRARIRHNGKQIHVGYYDSLDAAAVAATAKRNELFTHNELDRQTHEMSAVA